MRPSTEQQLREAREILEQWRRPSLRDEDWEAEMTELVGKLEVDPPRPLASDLKLERLERALVNWYYRAATPPRNDESSEN